MSPDGFMATRWLAILAHPPEALFVITAMLVAGALAGEFIARTTRLPRLVGYTGAGCVAAAVGLGAPEPLSGAARVLADLALALLLFEIGSRVHLRWLRRNPGLLATSLAEALLGALAVAAWPLSSRASSSPFMPGMRTSSRIRSSG